MSSSKWVWSRSMRAQPSTDMPAALAITKMSVSLRTSFITESWTRSMRGSALESLRVKLRLEEREHQVAQRGQRERLREDGGIESGSFGDDLGVRECRDDDHRALV